jgi:uncharacterized protein YabE (DUF348 family)
MNLRSKILEHRRVRKLKKLSRHPFAVPIGLFVLLIAIGVAGYHIITIKEPTSRNDEVVIITHDHTQQIVPSDEPTVGALLNKLDLKLGAGDVVEPAPDTPIDQDDFRINIYRAVPVEIVDGSNKIFTFSAAATARSIAVQAGVQLYPQDYTSTVPVQNFVEQGAVGEQIVINRATPVELDLYGTEVTTRTHAETVGQLLTENNIHPKSTDVIEPSLTTPITNNLPIFIARKGVMIESQTVAIAMPVDTIDDSTLALGTSAVRQVGSPGQEVNTYQIDTENGQPVSQTLVQTVVTVPAVTEIVVEGTNLSGIQGDMSLAGIQASDYEYANYIISHESGWCPTKWQGEYGTCPAYHGTPTSPDVGYGLCQATPGAKMASAGADWAYNPVTQLVWCNGYAVGRYGNWYNAYEHWVDFHSW